MRRLTAVIVMNGKIHFTEAPLSGLHAIKDQIIGKEIWFPYIGSNFHQGTLFLAIETIMVENHLATNVTSIRELRQCGKSKDFEVIYNAL